MKTVLRNLCIVSLPTVLIVGLALEIALRISGYVPFYLDGNAFASSPDPRILYELRPGFKGLYAGVPVSINSLGFRGEEPADDRDEPALRIAMIGDSIAFGQGVRDSETLSAQLQNALRSKTHEVVAVTNLGVPTYDTCQEYWRFQQHALSLKPQAVVLVYVSNDTEPPFLQVIDGRVISADVKPGWFGDMMGSLRKQSFLYNIVWSRWQVIKLGAPQVRDVQRALINNFESTSPGWKSSRVCLSSLASLYALSRHTSDCDSISPAGGTR